MESNPTQPGARKPVRGGIGLLDIRLARRLQALVAAFDETAEISPSTRRRQGGKYGSKHALLTGVDDEAAV
jgi:hypothetical protein